MAARVRRFFTDRSGNFGILFGLLAIPLVGGIGLMLDFFQVDRIRTELQQAADAAAVGSVAIPSPAFFAAGSMMHDGTIKDGVDDAEKLFEAEVSGDAKTAVTKVDPSVTKNGRDITAVVNFEATVPTEFMKILGVKSVDISGSASAMNSTPAFTDFYLLLDNTPSMGLGATQADIDMMVKNTPDKCAFACHETSNATDYYALAKLLKVTMRIDVVAQATAKMMDKAESTETYTDQYRMALYHFGEKAEAAGLQRLVKLTGDLDQIRTKASTSVDLMTVPYQNYNFDQDTDFNAALNAMDKQISAVGTGATSNSRLKYLLFVSDGVADYSNNSSCQKKTTGGRCQEPINTAYCDVLKNRGVKIAILYTSYYPLPTNGWYNTWIKPFESEIGARMESCASPGLFFEVSPTEGIAEAMNALFEKMISQPKIIN
ncbi:hypothetical protein CSC94_13525 [Zhengella mangrovi]|uniref:Putative Flp pilus-assembly TadG-like N-terminal domain-containing protein n=1 Tax=Zhengella mangrovi TaxID=1982044 RepID=A0A2G1QMH6_9HYPH|nr:TadE/TadG family type IV pilus assembly protein [Zhengella mangrovi]PHP66692.1 hypothetical protein CSC94_13525 [Zhengella mangrovi]